MSAQQTAQNAARGPDGSPIRLTMPVSATGTASRGPIKQPIDSNSRRRSAHRCLRPSHLPQRQQPLRHLPPRALGACSSGVRRAALRPARLRPSSLWHPGVPIPQPGQATSRSGMANLAKPSAAAAVPGSVGLRRICSRPRPSSRGSWRLSSCLSTLASSRSQALRSRSSAANDVPQLASRSLSSAW